MRRDNGPLMRRLLADRSRRKGNRLQRPSKNNRQTRKDTGLMSVKYKQDSKTVIRFWKHVEKSPNCWLWNGHKDSAGYGRFCYITLTNKRIPAHRFAYENINGKIKDGLVIDHLCRNPPCVNPDHLEPVTHKENILRGIGITAIESKKTHCPSEHPYDEKNTYKYKTFRGCRECRRNAIKKYEKNKRRKS